MPHAPRVVITRAPDQAQDLSQGIAALGCTPVHIPVFRIAPPADAGKAIDQALAQEWDWCVFTSGNAVRHVLQRTQALRARRIAVVGEATAAVAQAAGLQVDLIPSHKDAEGLLAALLQQLSPGQHYLLPQADNARPLLLQGLQEAGAQVCAPIVYRAVELEQPELPLPLPVAAITMASSATVARFCRLYAADLPRLAADRCVWVAIGRHTMQALADHHLAPRVQAAEPSVGGLLAALQVFVRQP